MAHQERLGRHAKGAKGANTAAARSRPLKPEEAAARPGKAG